MYCDLPILQMYIYKSLKPNFQPDEDPMKMLLTQMETFIKNLDLLQKKNYTTQGAHVYFKPLLDMFTAMNNFDPKTRYVHLIYCLKISRC